MPSSAKPVFVILPGAAQTPSHYAQLQHLLLSQGYGVLSALLPTVGTSSPVTIDDDADFIRSRMLLPVVDGEKHNVIMISHSYSGVPASAAAKGLGKSDRAADGKETSVLGQIFIAAMLPKSGDGKDLIATFGGQLPPHIRVDETENLIKCDNPKPPLFQDVSPVLADAAVLSAVNHCLTAFKSPCPVASWNEQAYRGRCAYIRTLNDRAVPYAVQNMIIEGTEQEWLIRDIETGHSPQLAAPDRLSNLIIELAQQFEVL